MTKYEFTLVLASVQDLTEELADELYAAGCDDGTPGSCEGIVTIEFHRAAASLESAIRSALEDVRKAGHQVVRVELEPATVAPAG